MDEHDDGWETADDEECPLWCDLCHCNISEREADLNDGMCRRCWAEDVEGWCHDCGACGWCTQRSADPWEEADAAVSCEFCSGVGACFWDCDSIMADGPAGRVVERDEFGHERPAVTSEDEYRSCFVCGADECECGPEKVDFGYEHDYEVTGPEDEHGPADGQNQHGELR